MPPGYQTEFLSLFVAFLWTKYGCCYLGNVIALGVFSFSCFLLSTAATLFTAWTSWCLQKALEMGRGALEGLLLLCRVTQKLERRGWDQGVAW